LQPQKAPTLTTTASSSLIPYPTGQEKIALLRAILEPQPRMESPAPTSVAITLKMRPESASLMENHQILEKSPIFTQNPPEPLSAGSFNWEEDTDSLSAPTTIDTAFETRSATALFMKNQRKSTIFNQDHPKSLILDENTTDFRSTATNEPPSEPATHTDQETSRTELPFPLIHDPFHLSVATSSESMPALFDYVSNAKASRTFENSTPSSGKDPPYSSSLSPFYHLYTTHKSFNISLAHISTQFFFPFLLSIFVSFTVLYTAY
jgi:hypothetical protein